jgi:hypothetical protein
VGENLVNDHRVFDAGNHFHRTVPGWDNKPTRRPTTYM